MTVMETFGVLEPQWILDRTGSGPQFWRADAGNGKKNRVKFLCDVQVKEYCPERHEYEEWMEEKPEISPLTMGMTCVFCVVITVILPWCLMSLEV